MLAFGVLVLVWASYWALFSAVAMLYLYAGEKLSGKDELCDALAVGFIMVGAFAKAVASLLAYPITCLFKNNK